MAVFFLLVCPVASFWAAAQGEQSRTNRLVNTLGLMGFALGNGLVQWTQFLWHVVFV